MRIWTFCKGFPVGKGYEIKLKQLRQHLCSRSFWGKGEERALAMCYN